MLQLIFCFPCSNVFTLCCQQVITQSIARDWLAKNASLISGLIFIHPHPHPICCDLPFNVYRLRKKSKNLARQLASQITSEPGKVNCCQLDQPWDTAFLPTSNGHCSPSREVRYEQSFYPFRDVSILCHLGIVLMLCQVVQRTFVCSLCFVCFKSICYAFLGALGLSSSIRVIAKHHYTFKILFLITMLHYSILFMLHVKYIVWRQRHFTQGSRFGFHSIVFCF